MAYADKCYVGKRVKLELLSQDDVKQIHEATLDVIENVGVKFHSQNALDILEANGVQALDNVSATSAVVSAQDCHTSTRVLHEFDACVRSSEKHNIVVSIKEDWEARSLIKMAEALAGGTEELKRRPMFTAIICTVSPLHQERFGMDLALVLAEAGIPVSFYPMPILGATGPITIAGSAVVNNAEFLSGATLVQLAHPGAKVIHGGGPTAMYMNSGAYASSSPEALLLG